MVDHPDYSGPGILKYFEEYNNPMTVLVEIPVEPKMVRCLPNQLKPIT